MGRWVWVEEHWEEVSVYGIAGSIFLFFAIGTLVFYCLRPSVDTVDVVYPKHVVVVEKKKDHDTQQQQPQQPVMREKDEEIETSEHGFNGKNKETV